SPPLLPISCPYPLPFSVPPPRPHRDLPSFPTRRSSDLRGVIAELSADELRATSHRWINRLGWLIEWNDATGFSLDRLFVSMPSGTDTGCPGWGRSLIGSCANRVGSPKPVESTVRLFSLSDQVKSPIGP